MNSHKRLSFVPGPTKPHEEILSCYSKDFGSSDLEDEFLTFYRRTQGKLQTVFSTNDATPVIMTGEGMLGLWGALKSTIVSQDRVLAVAAGIFGKGIGEMAKQIGANVKFIECDIDTTPRDIESILRVANEFKPKVITHVHCETPSGTLHDLVEIGKIARAVGALYYVDFVSSGFAVKINIDELGIDLGLLGSQKALSCLPDLSIIFVSKNAKKVIEEVKYIGYDAILPFLNVQKNLDFPYTLCWHAISALDTAIQKCIDEGMENVYFRHLDCADYTRKRIAKMGLELFPTSEEFCSPSVTAVKVPYGWTWSELQVALRAKGVYFGGSLCQLENKVFRIGHMGSQAQKESLTLALDILEEILSRH